MELKEVYTYPVYIWSHLWRSAHYVGHLGDIKSHTSESNIRLCIRYEKLTVSDHLDPLSKLHKTHVRAAHIIHELTMPVFFYKCAHDFNHKELLWQHFVLMIPAITLLNA